jgi:hypothetical protein
LRLLLRIIAIVSVVGILAVFGIGAAQPTTASGENQTNSAAYQSVEAAPDTFSPEQSSSTKPVAAKEQAQSSIPASADSDGTANSQPLSSINSSYSLAPSSPSYSSLPPFLQNFARDWKPEKSGGCLEIWDFTPGIKKIPAWLYTPESAEGLNTTNAYYILAGMLIRNKVVDASSCPVGGLASLSGDNLAANNCGMTAALPAVVSWQNRFNQKIYDTAQQTGIPAVLLKNVFRQESQFWPGVFLMETEGGLGQMTTAGVDTLLLWSPSLFQNLCGKSFSQDVCSQGYARMNGAEKAILQGALFQILDATCADCIGGIDADQADFSIDLFAENLLSNCKQVAGIVNEQTDVNSPSLVSTYPDLWKMTLFNYNAGPGCLERAILRAWSQDSSTLLTWDRVVSQVEPQCVGGIQYVDQITK